MKKNMGLPLMKTDTKKTTRKQYSAEMREWELFSGICGR
jgi:hypothetical protein